ncbi:MAG: arginine deiminase [Bacteroidales bacterium]|nr:arginine deiminase [Bacteroidales bacterium]MBQ4478662.1 arginine deiminase [Bacteroidales bacterium]
MDISVKSEIGRLNGVILHRPGIEIERMTPENIHKALYSDILSMNIAQREYALFEGVLQKNTQVFYVTDLLANILQDNNLKRQVVDDVCQMYQLNIQSLLLDMSVEDLSHVLIEGYAVNNRQYVIPPLYNLFFTRDASVSVLNKVMINKMKYDIREREAYLMQKIFQYYFHASTFHVSAPEVHIEGGDVLIAREDVLLVGNGCRTSRKAIDMLAEQLKGTTIKHIVIQQLPEEPDSFIHLDMVFTFLDKNACMCYRPLIAQPSRYSTIHIDLESGKAEEKTTLLEALQALHFDLQPIFCGGDDEWNQQREQWHSGANFFAMAPGKIIGYQRNTHTIEALHQHGFDVIEAADIVSGKDSIDQHQRCVVTVPSNELPRGGGGARCMTMPINRENVIW